MKVAISYVEGILGEHRSFVAEMPAITKEAVLEAVKVHVNFIETAHTVVDSSTWKMLQWRYDWDTGSFIISSEDMVRVYFAGLVHELIPIHDNHVGPFSDQTPSESWLLRHPG